MPTTYCTPAMVNTQLGVSTSFGAATDPKASEVESIINQNEDYIDQIIDHAFREVTVTDETHHIQLPPYTYTDGVPIFLEHRKIRPFNSSTDALNIWNGSAYEDYLDTRTEGRNNDFWVDYSQGIIFLKTVPTTVPRYFGAKITYRFGDEGVPKDVEKACIFLTCADILMFDDRSVLLPEGTSNISLSDKADKYRAQAMAILEHRREVKIAVN